MKHINKKIIVISIAILLILILSITLLLTPKAPVLTLHNNTTQDLYIYTMQSTYGEEPTIAEVDQLKKIKRINPNEQLIIPISAKYTNTSIVSVRWKLGSQAGLGDAVSTLIQNDKGACLMEIFIKENTSELIIPQTQPSCSKKIIPL